MCCHLYGSKHIRLKELLIAVGVVDQGAVVNNGVHIAAELLIHLLVQPQVRPCKVTCKAGEKSMASLDNRSTKT